MATRKIILEDNPLLRKKSKVVTVFDEKLWDLLDDMKETMRTNNGCGLAAPQIGILKRIVVVEVNGLYLEMINPEIISQKGNQCDVEGCLSVPNRSGYVNRPKLVAVRAYDRYGKEYAITGTDLLAICLCHEIDHLDGILYIDKMIKEYKGK